METDKKTYSPPEIEVVCFMTERGFANSWDLETPITDDPYGWD